MKKYLFLITAFSLFFSACNDPIFYSISLEEKILEPRIKGSPTNFVEFGNKMYVASGEYIYDYNGNWSDPRRVGGNILSLAVANNHIYALCVESELKKLRWSINGTYWDEVPDSSKHSILSIYSAGIQLFIGAEDSSGYSILNGIDFSKITGTGNNLLNGAAYDGTDYYLCVNDLKDSGGGIYRTNLSSTALISGDIPFMGIINTEIGSSPVVAISRNGKLYTVNTASVTEKVSFGNNHLATGALGVWEGEGGSKLLLAGRQDVLKPTINSGYTFGYLELDITRGISGEFIEPGKKTITTLNPGDKNERYQSTIGKIPVNAFYQAPLYVDSKKTLFASTQKNGLWSYRDRRGMWHWNAEE
jgi:hypothetical protein